MQHGVTLGREYVDEHTGYRGRAVSVHYYEYGCERVVLESIHDGSLKSETFDIPRLMDAETMAPAKPVDTKTGGDRDTVGKSAVPQR